MIDSFTCLELFNIYDFHLIYYSHNDPNTVGEQKKRNKNKSMNKDQLNQCVVLFYFEILFSDWKETKKKLLEKTLNND